MPLLVLGIGGISTCVFEVTERSTINGCSVSEKNDCLLPHYYCSGCIRQGDLINQAFHSTMPMSDGIIFQIPLLPVVKEQSAEINRINVYVM